MIRTLLLNFLLVFSTLSWGQQNPFQIAKPEHTSLLLQFEEKGDLIKLQNLSYDWIIKIEDVFVPYHIYKIVVDTEIKHIHAAERELAQLPFVKTIQPNRKIEQRSFVPNDSLYPNQWNMKRIQMEEAWGITTGGPTTLGDTVVIAIIDAGFDTSHPDFGNNLWINRNEIPGDTVDNDGNGYPGDYYGWNTYTDNDEILNAPEFAVHGMPVTGIIGAVGNNDFGIAGVGWNNRFLVIQGGGDEANALKSYGYVLVQKKFYIETDGAKGANIVATNSSWGMPGLFPNDAPLWCAFYDSLGKYGIVNVTAVPNSLSNVELNGDMPTLCPSNYIITVTSTNSLEKLNAAFGKFSVDLGAPGSSILSTASYVDGNRYKSINGTSVATPHVTGVVGLLHSAGCDSFSNYAKLYPDSAALWIKYFIMHGVDTTEELTERTVSYGRLNAYKALLLMQDWCEGKLNTNPGNPNPIDPDTTVIIPATYTLFPNPGVNFFTIRGDISKITRIEVVSLTGQIVYKVSLAQIQNPVEINIETSFGDGLYFVRTYNQKGEVIFVKKWMKME